jgi:hypothetical protein
MMNPTPALDAIAQQAVRPRMEYLSEVIASLIGSDAADPRVVRSVAMSDAVDGEITRTRSPSGSAPVPSTPGDVDAIARHIADFSIAGIRALRRSGASRECSFYEAPGFWRRVPIGGSASSNSSSLMIPTPGAHLTDVRVRAVSFP